MASYYIRKLGGQTYNLGWIFIFDIQMCLITSEINNEILIVVIGIKVPEATGEGCRRQHI